MKKGQVSYVGLLVMLFIVVIIGTSLISPIASNTETARNTTGIANTASSTLLSLNTLMYSVLIMGTVAGLAFLILRLSGFV